MENSDGIRAATHARKYRVWKFASECEDLFTCLNTDHAMKVSNHRREGVWSGNSSKEVMSSRYIRNPIAHRFVKRIFERL